MNQKKNSWKFHVLEALHLHLTSKKLKFSQHDTGDFLQLLTEEEHQHLIYISRKTYALLQENSSTSTAPISPSYDEMQCIAKYLVLLEIPSIPKELVRGSALQSFMMQLIYCVEMEDRRRKYHLPIQSSLQITTTAEREIKNVSSDLSFLSNDSSATSSALL